MSRQLVDLLAKDKVITATQLTEALEANKQGKDFLRFLQEKKYVSESKLLYYLGQKFSLPSINLEKIQIAPEVIRKMPLELVRKTRAMPVQVNRDTLVVAICDPTQMASIQELKFVVKMNIEVVLTTPTAFDSTVYKCYGGAASVGSAIESYQKENKDAATTGGVDLVQVHDIDLGSASAQDAPVIQLVNGILGETIRRRASDTHVEPYESRMRVRVRVDGVLYEIAQVPIEMKRAVVARFKIMARMDIAETRIPQDGRIKIKFEGKDVDFRANALPTLFGEKVVLRILSKGSIQLDFSKLGFEKRQLEIFQKGFTSPNGLLLVTGPTGSGKTTTLYSALAELNKTTDNLSTVEDPVEYNFEGINQTQINKDVGLTFANALRALLRQDPDVILVGEIRDFETAEVAIHAALTGHLVLSTLHTNDSISTITRLVNMGIEPFLVVASVNTIVAQRLLRTVCAGCKVEERETASELPNYGVSKEEIQSAKFYRGSGCDQCNQTGFKGRVAIYEVLDFSAALKEMVLKGGTAAELKKQAMEEGLKTLRMAGISKVLEGRTTLEEVLGNTLED
jgi:type IV pilus assembly protein PilB